MAGCSGLESCRDLTPAQIKKASTDAGKNVRHPIKLVLEPGFGPVVDGNYIPGNVLQLSFYFDIIFYIIIEVLLNDVDTLFELKSKPLFRTETFALERQSV